MGEIRLTGPSMEQRIASRLRNSGGNDADVSVTHGSGPTRTITNIHHSRVADHGAGKKPEAPKAGGRR